MRREPHGHRRGLLRNQGARVQAPALLLQASVSCLLVRSDRGRGRLRGRGRSLAQRAAPDWPTQKHQSPAARRPSSSAGWGHLPRAGRPLRRSSRPLGTVWHGSCCVRSGGCLAAVCRARANVAAGPWVSWPRAAIVSMGLRRWPSRGCCANRHRAWRPAFEASGSSRRAGAQRPTGGCWWGVQRPSAGGLEPDPKPAYWPGRRSCGVSASATGRSTGVARKRRKSMASSTGSGRKYGAA